MRVLYTVICMPVMLIPSHTGLFRRMLILIFVQTSLAVGDTNEVQQRAEIQKLTLEVVKPS